MIFGFFRLLIRSSIDPPPVVGSVGYTQFTSASETRSPRTTRLYRIGRPEPQKILPFALPDEPGRSKCLMSSHTLSAFLFTTPERFRKRNGGSNSLTSSVAM